MKFLLIPVNRQNSQNLTVSRQKPVILIVNRQSYPPPLEDTETLLIHR